MRITPQYAERMKKLVREEPLSEGELRRVVGLGETHIALSDTPVDEPYYFVFSAKIYGVSYSIYFKR